MRLDIATIHNGVPCIVTEGLTAGEQAIDSKDPGQGYKFKAARENTEAFPMDLFQRGLEVALILIAINTTINGNPKYM